MKTIVVDTNALHDIYWFNQAKWQLIFSAIENLPYKLSIPIVIYHEIIAHYRKKLSDSVKSYNRQISDCNFLINEDKIDLINIDIDFYTSKYKDEFDKISRHEKIIIEDYPDISHELLILKAANKIKPFKHNGSGYRDTLIWESIKKLLINDEQIIFITNNWKDFCDESHKNLHQDLKRELQNNPDIVVYESLEKFEQCELSKQYKQLDDLKLSIEINEHDAINNIELLEMLRKSLNNREIEHSFEDSNDGQAIVQYVEDLNIINVLSAIMIDDNRSYIQLECEVELSVNYFVDKWDLYSNDEPSYGVEDSDWNDHVALVSGQPELNIVIDIIFECNSGEVSEFNYHLE